MGTMEQRHNLVDNDYHVQHHNNDDNNPQTHKQHHSGMARMELFKLRETNDNHHHHYYYQRQSFVGKLDPSRAREQHYDHHYHNHNEAIHISSLGRMVDHIDHYHYPQAC